MATRRSRQDDLLAEYEFDYGRASKNRFAPKLDRGARIVVLDPDVARVFKDSKGVNDLLRATIVAVRRPRKRARD